MTRSEVRDLLEIARTAADAGAAVLRRSGLPLPGGEAELKGTGDYVTAIDRRSEEAILAVLQHATPEIPVLAEESGGVREGTRWVVDPLDGTTNFMRGLPIVGVSVGLVSDSRPVLGVVLGPFLDLAFSGGSELGVERNGEQLPRLRAIATRSAVVATGFPFRDKSRLPRYHRVLDGALLEFEDLRRAGAASLDMAWVASGAHDGFFEMGLSPWDVAAAAALVVEVGGRVSDWDGADRWLESGNIVAGSTQVHEALLRLTEAGGADASTKC